MPQSRIVSSKTYGKFEIILDDEFVEFFDKYKWSIDIRGVYHKIFYVKRAIKGVKNKFQYLHRVIMNCNKKEKVDHINGNTLDNRKCNLRLCTGSQNSANTRKKASTSSSIYKGVSFYSRDRNWLAQIRCKGVYYYLGYYKTEIEAAVAYNNAAEKLFGKFAKLNIIEGKY